MYDSFASHELLCNMNLFHPTHRAARTSEDDF